ncbi:MAG: AmmeMemoRadiSam system radical SAM enzyme [Candidatus Muirbacterium halophilum]|nr:AmmeMemoRadiSam system radical SAM enzyme [Candidatus Muirbacterium halophilum]MCK9475974.1 AmmeMemoRadiSam system radical SAM enzyme [Candidatus Muirbacterium halophilum]
MIKEAYFYKKHNDTIICTLCPNACKFEKDKDIGKCLAYRRDKDILISENYAKITSIALDPIEKKPLSRYLPKSNILSIGTFGCNMHCPFCQNSEISQTKVDYTEVSPQKLLQKALELVKNGNIGIAFTYNEPFVWYEFVYETAKLFKENSLNVVLVTNGQINSKPLEKILPFIDALNIDLKSIKAEFYNDYCFGNLNTVKNTIKKCHENGKHIEITNLVIPQKNDTFEEFEELTDFVKTISEYIPLHISRYFPRYKEDILQTPIHTINKFKEIAEKKLKFVYTGNV